MIVKHDVCCKAESREEIGKILPGIDRCHFGFVLKVEL